MDDYRVKTGFRSHHKRKKLRKRLGTDALIALYDLWSFCAESRTDGNLCGMTNEDIALACDAPGNPDEFVTTLLDCELLDGEPLSYNVHDWLDWNPWVAGHKERSDRARAAAGARWKTETEKTPDEPKQKPKPISKELRDDVLRVFVHYRLYHTRAHKKPSAKSKEWRSILARMAEGYSTEDLCAAIDGCHRSAFHMGDNDHGKKYDSLELITRDGSKVQSFAEVPLGGEKPTPPSAFVDSARRVAEWANEGERDEADRVCGTDDKVAGVLPKRVKR